MTYIMPRPAPQDRAAVRAAREARDAEACRLAALGWQYSEVAEKLGFRTRQAAHAAVKRMLERRIKEGDAAVALFRARQDALLDEALKVATEIMERRHLAVANGKVVQRFDEATGEYVDVYDDALNLAAADKLIKISESRRKMHGADAPAKVETSGEQTISYVVNATPEEMESL